MNKTAYNKGLIKYAAMSAARFYHRALPYAIGFGGLGLGGIGLGGIVMGLNNRISLLLGINNNVLKATGDFAKFTALARPLILKSTKLLVAVAKDKLNTFDANTIGKYALGGAGIIGGSILLGNLLSRSKKRRKKDLDLELEA